MKHAFFGGVHPLYQKEMSAAKPAPSEAVRPKQVVIPLLQHIGAPCKPLVQVGDQVLLGQKIGDGEGLCVPVHASVSGTVVAVEPRPHPKGMLVESVVIDNDFRNASVTLEPMDAPVTQLDVDAVLHRIREAGIVGMGGAAFPGNVKALSAMHHADVLIANACECEPYITADDTLLRTAAKDVLDGMMILKRVLSPDHVVLAVEDNKEEAIEKLVELLEEYPAISLRILPTKYPQGSEKQLIQAITGLQVPPGELPIRVGCAVFNVSTFAAIYRAVRLGTPLTQRLVTVSGEAITTPQNFVVPIGTSFHDLIQIADGLHDRTERVINGGPMMGSAQGDLSVPVVKATNSILCLLKDENGAAENPVCLRCGKCVSVCPMHLQPLYLYRYVKAGRTQALARLHVTDCMECGSCAYTCPGKLPLVEQIRKGKQMLKEAKSK